MVRITEKSSAGNKAVAVDDAIQWQDWKSYLGDSFKALKGISKYHHFRFSALNPGVVMCKETRDSEERAITLLNSDVELADLPHNLQKGMLYFLQHEVTLY